MDNLIVKPVDVLGSSIMAAQDKEGSVFAGVSYFCNALGMTRGQKNRQVKNVQKDETLKRGCIKLGAGVLDEGNEAVALRIDFIPIWLAKISITDKTKQENPELADKLLEYQLKAKDILAEAFMPKQSLPQTTDGKIALLAQGHTELKAEVDEIKAEVKALKDDMPVFQADAKDIQSDLRKKAVEALGGYKSPAYNDKSTRTYVFADIQRELKRQFDVKRYDQIKHKDTPIALEVIAQYRLPLALKNRVDMVNAQQTLDLKGGVYRG